MKLTTLALAALASFAVAEIPPKREIRYERDANVTNLVVTGMGGLQGITYRTSTWLTLELDIQDALDTFHCVISPYWDKDLWDADGWPGDFLPTNSYVNTCYTSAGRVTRDWYVAVKMIYGVPSGTFTLWLERWHSDNLNSTPVSFPVTCELGEGRGDFPASYTCKQESGAVASLHLVVDY